MAKEKVSKRKSKSKRPAKKRVKEKVKGLQKKRVKVKGWQKKKQKKSGEKSPDFCDFKNDKYQLLFSAATRFTLPYLSRRRGFSILPVAFLGTSAKMIFLGRL